MAAGLRVEQFRRHQAGLAGPGPAADLLVQRVAPPGGQRPGAVRRALVRRCHRARADQAALPVQRIQPRAVPRAAERPDVRHARAELFGHLSQRSHQRRFDRVRAQLAAASGQMRIGQRAARGGQRGSRPRLEGDCLQAGGPHIDTQEDVGFHVMTLST
ncbi:hypothetical protein D3C72_1583610 [compost metagenome]